MDSIGYFWDQIRDELAGAALRYLGGLVAGAGMGWLAYWQKNRRRNGALEARVLALNQEVAALQQAFTAFKESGAAQVLLPTTSTSHTTTPRKKPCPLGPREIVGLVANLTTDLSRDVVLASFRDTWLRVEGAVYEVSILGGGGVGVDIRLPDGLNVDFWMKEEVYTAEDFTSIKKGDIFIAEGKIYSADSLGIILDECELVSPCP